MDFKTEFGYVEINGKKFDYDIILYCDGSIFRREKSKKLVKENEHTPFSIYEVEDLFKKEVEVVYIGTGQYGKLPVKDDVIEEIRKKVKEVIIDTTPKILEKIKNDKRRWVALIHVTC